MRNARKKTKKSLPCRKKTARECYLFACAVGMYARTLGGREVVDAPPAHLQKDEGGYEHPEGQTFGFWLLALSL
jgi:hypothetical protein